jgi:hypothetical protein
MQSSLPQCIPLAHRRDLTGQTGIPVSDPRKQGIVSVQTQGHYDQEGKLPASRAKYLKG